MTGTGEPMSVGELVAIDGFDVVMAWAGVFVSDASWSCRLLFRKWIASWLSISSKALFLIFSILESDDASDERAMMLNYEC